MSLMSSSSRNEPSGNESSLGLLPASLLQDENTSMWPNLSRQVRPDVSLETAGGGNLREDGTEPVKRDEDESMMVGEGVTHDESISSMVELDVEDLHNLDEDFSDFSDIDYDAQGGEPSNDKVPSDGSDIDIGPRAGQGVGCARDSRSSSEVDTEYEIQNVLRQGSVAPPFYTRPGLEGMCSHDSLVQPSPVLVERECAEGSVVTSPVPGDGGGGGDGSSGHTSDSSLGPAATSLPVRTNTSLRLFRPDQTTAAQTRVGPLGDEDLSDVQWKADFTLPNEVETTSPQASGLMSHLLLPGAQAYADSYVSTRPWGADESSFNPESCLRPRDLQCQGDGSEEIAMQLRRNTFLQSESDENLQTAVGISLAPTAPPLDLDADETQQQPPNVVTSEAFPVDSVPRLNSLAYHSNMLQEFGQGNPFDLSDLMGFKEMNLNDNEFMDSDKALELLNKDEYDFEQENRFLKDDAMKNVSLGCSWQMPQAQDVTRPSWLTDEEDGPNRISFGQFLRSRTAALGSLGETNAERPYFGTRITTPPRSRKSVRLVDSNSRYTDRSLPESEAEYRTNFHGSLTESLGSRTGPFCGTDESTAVAINTISHVISTASLSADPQKMTDIILQVSKGMSRKLHSAAQVDEREKFPHQPTPASYHSLPQTTNKGGGSALNEQYVNSASQFALCDPLRWEVIRPSTIPSDSIAYNESELDRSTHVHFKTPALWKETPATWQQNDSTFDVRSKAKYATSTPFHPHNPLAVNFTPSVLSVDTTTPMVPERKSMPKRSITSTFDETTPTASNYQRTVVEQESTLQQQQLPTNTAAETQFSTFLSNQTAEVQTVASCPKTSGLNAVKNVARACPPKGRSLPDQQRSMQRPTELRVPAADSRFNFQPLKMDTTADSEHLVGDRMQPRQQALSMGPTVSLNRVMALKIPDAVTFETVVCIGVSAEATLSIYNPIAEWVQCILEVENLYINGTKCLSDCCPFTFKNKVVCEPSSTETVKVTFLSQISGKVVAEVKVLARIMSRQVDLPACQVLIHAEAEQPAIQVFLDQQNALDFGVIPEDSCSVQSLGLVNLGQAPVPIRLVIEGNSSAWKGFYFPKKNADSASPPPRTVLSQQSLSCTLPCHAPGETSVVNFQVGFRAQQLQTPDETLLPVSGSIKVELDVTSAACSTLQTVPLVASVGRALLETALNIQPVLLQAVPGTSVVQSVPLRNSGSIPLQLVACVQQHSELFKVSPATLSIGPDQQTEVELCFLPRDHHTSSIKTKLQLSVHPGGLVFELDIVAETVAVVSIPQDFNLESNKQLMAWPGAPLGRSHQQTVTLRNCSPTGRILLQLRIHTPGQNFWIVTQNQRLTEALIEVPPLGEHELTVAYDPTTLAHNFSKLTIKPLEYPIVNQPVRFVVPLVGYGGTSVLELVSSQTLTSTSSGSYFQNVGAVSPGDRKFHQVFLRNIGQRASFCKVLGSNAAPGEVPSLGTEIIVPASELIIEVGQTVEVVVAIRVTPYAARGQGSPPETCLGAIDVYYGDEVNRRRVRRLKPRSAQTSFPSDHSLYGTNFDVQYAGQALKTKEEDLPPTSYDAEMFFGGFNCIRVWLMTDQLQRNTSPTPDHRLTRPVSSASPPVRESNVTEMRQPVASGLGVAPKVLVFNLASDTRTEEKIILANRSAVPIRFQLIWPGNLLNVSPAEGTISPRKRALVKVVPLDRLQIEEAKEATVVVKCDKYQKEVKVKLIKGMGAINRAAVNEANPPPAVAKSPIKVLVKKILFPVTVVTGSSDYHMEMSNTSQLTQRWTLSSVAPTKITKPNVAPCTVSYSVFRFAKLSGQLRTGETVEIPVTFYPLDKGEFSQVWELISEDGNKKRNKTVIKLRGKGVVESENALTATVVASKDDGPRTTRKTDKTTTRCIYSPSYAVEFPPTKCQTTATCKVAINNNSTTSHEMNITLATTTEPFHVFNRNVTIKPRSYIRLPVHFKPKRTGSYKTTMVVSTDLDYKLEYEVSGVAV